MKRTKYNELLYLLKKKCFKWNCEQRQKLLFQVPGTTIAVETEALKLNVITRAFRFCCVHTTGQKSNNLQVRQLRF